MINPAHVTVTKPDKQPIPGNTLFHGRVTFTVIHRVDNLLLEGELTDTDRQAMAHRIEDVVRRAVWAEAYGALMEPLADLIDVAGKCPSNYQTKAGKAIKQINSLLTMPEIQPANEDLPTT